MSPRAAVIGLAALLLVGGPVVPARAGPNDVGAGGETGKGDPGVKQAQPDPVGGQGEVISGRGSGRLLTEPSSPELPNKMESKSGNSVVDSLKAEEKQKMTQAQGPPAGDAKHPDTPEAAAMAAGLEPGAEPGAALKPASSRKNPAGFTPARAQAPGGAPPTAKGTGTVDAPPVVERKQATETSQIATTAGGKRALGTLGRVGTQLGQQYKTTEGGIPGGAKPNAGDGKPSGSPRPSTFSSAPRVLDELLLQSLSGRQQAVSDLGLRVVAGEDGRARVLRRDGAPASPAQVEELRQRLAAAPQALVQRPDFFSALPREHYEALKAEYARTGGDAPAFRDVGLRAERDFQWARTCTRVSGGCNPLAVEDHYERGRDVSPETLEAIHRETALPEKAEPKAVSELDEKDPLDLGGFDADDERVAEASRLADERRPSRSVTGGLAARLKGLLSGLGFGGQGGGGAPASSYAAAVSGSPSPRAADPQRPLTPRERAGSAVASAEPATRVAQSAPPASTPSAGNDAAPRPWARGAGAGAAVLAALALWALSRRDA